MRFLALLCAFTALAASAASAAAEPLDVSARSGMRWRLVGPFRGGRALSAAGVPGEPDHFYFGSVGGGVWETKNAGRTWTPVFDSQPIASIGAVAVAPSAPKTLYVGSGEADMRSDISYGNGVYKSVDGGRTWSHAGLSDTRQIGKILVDPRDPNLVFVAALGHAYGPNTERGVFRSRDGGRTWSRVLFRDQHTGAIDLAFAPGGSKTIFAALWQTRRPPWNVYPPSNGPGSGLYRSDDGGDTWKPVRGKGFPSEALGRIGLAFAPSDRSRLYAVVDAKEGGLYASRDGGVTWKRTSADPRIWGRGWYFGGVTVDPRNAETVYVCNTTLYRSSDGGTTFVPMKGDPTGDDFHELWIDPFDPRRMITASDQGTVVSVDGGATWSSWYNQPTAQLYHVVTDDRFPYWLYGAQQDSGAVAVPSRTDFPSIMQRDWRPISGGGESGAIAPDPADPNVLYGGTVGRFDQTTLQEQDVNPVLAHPGEYRSEWTLPLTFSSRNPRALYFGNQFVFRTSDGGEHWEKISPDLTRENPGTPANLVPADAANSSAPGSRRGVVYTIAPSPLKDGLIWCGTDDGLVWVTRDDGAHWNEVTPAAVTPWSKVGILEASHFDPETAYAAVDRHRLDDLRPWIYRTRDGGRNWSLIAGGIPDGSFVNVVREDPVKRGLLYAGTETGVFVSFDDGGSWQPLQLNLPSCSIRDIAIRRNDLVVATHGRSFWILDDLSPLQQMDAAPAAAEAWLFSPREALRLHPAPFQGTPEPRDEPAGENPPVGATIDYRLSPRTAAPISVDILDARGNLVRHWASDEPRPAADLSKITSTPDWVADSAIPDASPGMHRFVWDLRYAAPQDLDARHRSRGVLAAPGRYSVRLTVSGRALTVPLTVVRDRRIKATDADLERQLELARNIETERVAVARALARAEKMRTALPAGAPSWPAFDAVVGTGDPALEDSQPATEIPTTLQRAATALLRLQDAVESADAAPTPDAVAAFEIRREAAREALRRFEEIAEKR
ncbi:MAG: hypothetical protein ABI682_09440 [Acidobacteriota bacterium]